MVNVDVGALGSDLPSLSSQVSRGREARTAWGPRGHRERPGSLGATAFPGRGARRGPRASVTWPPATRPTASCGRSTTAKGRTTSVVPLLLPPSSPHLTCPGKPVPQGGGALLPDPNETYTLLKSIQSLLIASRCVIIYDSGQHYNPQRGKGKIPMTLPSHPAEEQMSFKCGEKRTRAGL